MEATIFVLRAAVPLVFGDTEIVGSGLLRCCIASIHEYVMPRAETPAPDELVISCLYEAGGDSENIILEKGVWRWNHE